MTHVTDRYMFSVVEPSLDPERSRSGSGLMDIRALVWAGVVVILVMLSSGLIAWVQLPAGARVPIHWGPTGQTDRTIS